MYTPNTPTSTGRRGYVGIDRRWLAAPELTDSMLRLMLWLDSHSDEYLAALDQTRSAKEIGWSRDRMKRTLDLLAALGLVSTEIVAHKSNRQRTRITVHHEVWSDPTDALRRGEPMPYGEARPMPYGEARPMPYGEATSTSTLIDRKEVLELSVASHDAAFDLFWETYGKVGPRKVARRCWDKATRTVSPQIVQAGLERWVEYWLLPDSAKVKWPQGWLSDERWDDEPPFKLAAVESRSEAPGMGALRRRAAAATQQRPPAP